MMNNDKLMIYFGLLVFVLELMGGFIQMTFLTGWMYAVVWLVLFIGQYSGKNIMPQKAVALFVIFLLIVSLYRLRGGTYAHWSSIWHMVGYLVNVMFPFAFTCFLINRGDKQSYQISIGVISAIMVIYTLTTAKLTSVDPMMVRYSIHDEVLRNSMGRLGLCTYALPHAVPFIVPALIYAIKYSAKRLVKLLWIALLIFDFWLIYVGGASTPMLLFIIAVLLSLLVSPKRSMKSNISCVVIIGLCCMPLLNDNVLLAVLEPLDTLSEGTVFNGKVVDIQNTIIDDDASGDVYNRMEKYTATLDAITSNFILGTTDSSKLGGHSYFLDVFASLGLFSIIFFAYIIAMYRFIRKWLSESSRLFFFLCFFMYVLECSLKNIDAFEYYAFAFTLAPAICIFIDQQHKAVLPNTSIG